jgi:phosphatidylglycerol:prolipoprotein diacylglycerol transferase
VADFVFFAAVFGVLVGGRLGYVLFYRPQMIVHPLEIFQVWDGGMASHGGILGLVVFSFIYARRHHISWTGIGDNLVAVAPLGLMFGRLANFINGELYGRPTTVPWAMQFPSELLDPSFPADKLSAVVAKCEALVPSIAQAVDPVRAIIADARTNPQIREVLSQFLTPRHPSQLYEALLEGLLLFVCLITIRLRFRQPNGVTTGCFFLLYPTMRIIGEMFREPDAPLTGPFSRGQFLSLFMFLVGIAFLVYAFRQKKGSAPG